MKKSTTKPKLGPIIIGVTSIEKVKEFYVKVFEIEIAEQKENYLSAYLNETHIEIEEDCENRFPNWKEHNVGTYKNSEFIVPDMQAFVRKVVEHGGTIISQPTERPWGATTAEIADPEGNIFLISQEKENVLKELLGSMKSKKSAETLMKETRKSLESKWMK